MTRLGSVVTLVVAMMALTTEAQIPASVSGDVGNKDAATTVSGGTGAGVKNAPFTADDLHEGTSVTPAGKEYRHEIRGRVFRDSEGRFRQEILSGMGPEGLPGPLHVEIVDPTKKVIIILEPQIKKASIRHLDATQSVAPASTTAATATKNSGTEPQAPEPEPSFGPHIGTMTTGPNGGVMYHGAPPEQLGTRYIEGFTVTGTRSTWIAAKGTFGNDKPMTQTLEIWYSPDLKIDLLTEGKGPRGSQIHKLVNIQIADPDPLLFQVPAGYTVKEEPRGERGLALKPLPEIRCRVPQKTAQFRLTHLSGRGQREMLDLFLLGTSHLTE